MKEPITSDKPKNIKNKQPLYRLGLFFLSPK